MHTIFRVPTLEHSICAVRHEHNLIIHQFLIIHQANCPLGNGVIRLFLIFFSPAETETENVCLVGSVHTSRL